MIRKAQAVWNGDLINGAGTLTTDSKVLNATQYSFKTRFEDGAGTNPEELVAAAHAGCFSMAFAMLLSKEGITVQSITTTAEVSLDKVGDGFEVTASHLITNVVAPGADGDKIVEVSQVAEENCPISKLLNAQISVDTTYEV